MATKDRICIALDVSSIEHAQRLVAATSQYVGYYKIGLQLFCAEGPKIVDIVIREGGNVFLDLKLHDIPNTVAEASRSIVSLGVQMFNVHAAGGRAMMEAAKSASLREGGSGNRKRPLVIAVTLLTSLNSEILRNELRVTDDSLTYATRLAALAKDSGLDGIVSSAHETESLRKELGDDFYIVNPGIRPKWALDAADDQKRVTTPADAIRLGADLIVVGRPIVKAGDPTDAARRVYDEVDEAMSDGNP